MQRDNNPDKRLQQDNIEQRKKSNASSGMLVAGVIILIGIIAGTYLYKSTAVETQEVNQINAVPVATVVTPGETPERDNRTNPQMPNATTNTVPNSTMNAVPNGTTNTAPNGTTNTVPNGTSTTVPATSNTAPNATTNTVPNGTSTTVPDATQPQQ